MSSTENGHSLKFEELLNQTVEHQINEVGQGKDIFVFLENKTRQTFIEQVKTISEDDADNHKLFDRTSLKQISLLFDESEAFYKRLQEKDQLASLIYPNTKKWFQESYRYMFDSVSMLEIIRYFAGGKTQSEKELIFRSLVSKLIKTQETIRVIKHNQKFVESYLKKHQKIKEKLPAIAMQALQLSKETSPQESVLTSLNHLVSDISKSCLDVFDQLDIPLQENAKLSASKKNYYNALILTIRHSPDELFGTLGSDLYPVLLEYLNKVIVQSHLHSTTCLFQHIKREYLTYWLIHILRLEDKSKGDTFYQTGKAKVYSTFKPYAKTKELLMGLKDFKQLESQEIIKQEISSLQALSEDDFYDLLLKIYTLYKNDHTIRDNLPMTPQSLSSAGDTTWEQKNITAQAGQKVERLKKEPQKSSKLKRFLKMFTSLKKAEADLGEASFKKEKAIQQQSSTEGSSSEITQIKESSTETSNEEEESYRPVLEIKHTGELLEPCFPLPYYEVLDPVKGQKQDVSFCNHDQELSEDLEAQLVIVDLFNIEEESNSPLNKSYTKFANTVEAILRAYSGQTKKIQKKFATGQAMKSVTEEVVYLQTDNDAILALGITDIGQNPHLGKFPNRKTAYFRLFVKGELMRMLPKANNEFILKSFSQSEKSVLFKHVGHSQFSKEPMYSIPLIEGLLTILESLPKEEFDLINNDGLVGFMRFLQGKANLMMMKHKKLIFKRAS